ncbi:DUF559 domain-containing protein [bacterium]|nr:DUF559 domain-containing protein [bacterium]
MKQYNRNLKDRARKLRNGMTDSEKLLWAQLRKKQLNNLQFYRQRPIGQYIVDFYCPKAKLIIEVDGPCHSHRDQIAYDKQRDAYLTGLGMTVLRFSNRQITYDIDTVIASITYWLDSI